MSIRIKKAAFLALVGCVIALNGAEAKNLENLRTAPAQDAHKVTKVNKASEVKITPGMKIMQSHKDQFGNAFIVRTKMDAVKAREGQKEVQILLSLIALFGSMTMALIFFIIKAVHTEHEMQKNMKVHSDSNAMEIKDYHAASNDIIVTQLNKIQKATKEENAKLISSSSSSRPSAMTQANSDDVESFSNKSSSRMKNLDNPFTVKKLKIDTKSKSDPVDDEKSKSAISSSSNSGNAPKMSRNGSNKTTVKYDRKDVKKPESATPTTPATPTPAPAAAKAKAPAVKKRSLFRGGWK